MPPPGTPLPPNTIIWPDFDPSDSPRRELDAPYIKTTPPESFDAFRYWIDDELRRIQQNLEALTRDESGHILFGDADDVPWTTVENPIVNYTDSAVWQQGQSINIDPVAGTITVPSDGIYQVRMYVGGNQGNNSFNEDMFLMLRLDAASAPVARQTVPSNKTSGRIFASSVTRRLNVNQVLQLATLATADMGTFAIEQTSFELVRIF